MQRSPKSTNVKQKRGWRRQLPPPKRRLDVLKTSPPKQKKQRRPRKTRGGRSKRQPKSWSHYFRPQMNGDERRSDPCSSVALFFAGMVRGFEIGADVFQSERRWFEFSACVEHRLVHVMRAPGISARAEGVNRECADAWGKLNNTDIGSSGNAVPAFLSTDRCGVKREDSPVITIHARHSKAGPRVLKLFVLAFIATLKTREFAPGNFPRPEITLKCSITSVSV